MGEESYLVDATLFETEFRKRWDPLSGQLEQHGFYRHPLTKTLAVSVVVLLVRQSLASQGIKGWLMDALIDFMQAVDHIKAGKNSELFKPHRQEQGGRPPDPIDTTILKALAAAAITLAKRGEKEEVARRAARALGTTAKKLRSHRKALTRGPGPSAIKSRVERQIYDEVVGGNGKFWVVLAGAEEKEMPDRRPTSDEVIVCLEKYAAHWSPHIA